MKNNMNMQGTMTDAEKKMNKEDLKHYKDYDTNIRAMVIGL
jgi:hypothetical protein